MSIGGQYNPEALKIRLEKLLIISEELEHPEDVFFLRIMLRSIDYSADSVILDGCDVIRILDLERKYLG